MLCYLNYIVIYAKSIEDETKLKAIFNRLQLDSLKLQPNKCEFMRNEVSYLGHIITNKGIKFNP